MKIQITKIEPEYIDISTQEGQDWLLNHYEVHFRNVAPDNDIKEFKGVMCFSDIDTHENLKHKIKQRIIAILNEED